MKLILLFLIAFNAYGSTPLIKINYLTKFSNSEKSRLHEEVIPKINEIMHGECFKNFIHKRDLKKTNGKSNAEVYNHLISSTVPISLIMYYSPVSTVGYTYPGTDQIHMNRKFHNGFSVCKSSANIAHERSHKIKYGHTSRHHKGRPFSVPYSVGEGFKRCCPVYPLKKSCSRTWRTLWLKKVCTEIW